MFNYTKAAFSLIIKELKLFSKIFKWSLIIFSTFYYIYAIIFNIGNVLINASLLLLTASYTIFEICTKRIENKDLKKVSKKIYSFAKLFIRAVSLGGTIYGLYSSSITMSNITTILLPLMIILWILQVLLELVICVMEKYIEFIITGIREDIKDFVGVAGKVTDVLFTGGMVGAVKKVIGKDKEPEDESPILERLDKEIEKKKTKRKKVK